MPRIVGITIGRTSGATSNWVIELRRPREIDPGVLNDSLRFARRARKASRHVKCIDAFYPSELFRFYIPRWNLHARLQNTPCFNFLAI
jgi:hypothetical protein